VKDLNHREYTEKAMTKPHDHGSKAAALAPSTTQNLFSSVLSVVQDFF
jgi:hypothetical protein